MKAICELNKLTPFTTIQTTSNSHTEIPVIHTQRKYKTFLPRKLLALYMLLDSAKQQSNYMSSV